MLALLLSILFSFFFWLSSRKPLWAICLPVFLLPSYLMRFSVFGMPTNFLEMLIGVLLLGRMAKWGIRRRYKGLRKFKGEKEQSKENQNISYKIQAQKFLYIGILLLITGVSLATAFSLDQLASLGILKSWFIVPLIFVFVLLETTIASPINLRIKAVLTILKTLALSGLFVSLISLGYLLNRRLTYDGRLRAFYEHPNQLAMYLAPCWLMAYGLWLMATRKNKKKLWLSSLILISIPIFFTYSYGTWVGIMGGILVLMLGWKRENKKLREIRRKRKKWPYGFTALQLYGFMALSLMAILLFVQLNQPKLQNIFTTQRSSFHSRLMIWRSALYILKDNWLVGIGPGIFQKYYLAYQKYFPPYLEWAVPQPHNIFLAFWLQTGITGFIGFILILIWFFKRGIMEIKEKLGGVRGNYEEIGGIMGNYEDFKRKKEGLGGIMEDKKITVLLMAVMVYVLIHGLVDTTYWKNDLSIIWWLLIGIMMIIQETKEIKRKNYADKGGVKEI